jgi:hypothetical protein
LLRARLEAVNAQTTRADDVIAAGRWNDLDTRRVAGTFVGKTRPRWIDVSEPGHLPPIGGLAEATGDVVASLDDDGEPETFLGALTGPLKDHNVASVRGRYVGMGGVADEVNEAGRFCWYGRFTVASAHDQHAFDAVVDRTPHDVNNGHDHGN